MKKKAFIVVGHSNWGKSFTLSAFTKGDLHTRHMNFFRKDFYVRRISNDDEEDKLLIFVNISIQENGFVWEDYLLMTLCPQFDGRRGKATSLILTRLFEIYDLYFFVIHESYRSGETISDEQINTLRNYGEVEVLYGHHEANVRARNLNNFIRVNL